MNDDGPPEITGIPTIPQLAAQANVPLQPNAQVGMMQPPYFGQPLLVQPAITQNMPHQFATQAQLQACMMQQQAHTSSTLPANAAAVSASSFPAKPIRFPKFQLPPTKPRCAKESPEGATENGSDRRLQQVHRSLGTTLEMPAHR
jgi:hypothetical protein